MLKAAAFGYWRATCPTRAELFVAVLRARLDCVKPMLAADMAAVADGRSPPMVLNGTGNFDITLKMFGCYFLKKSEIEYYTVTIADATNHVNVENEKQIL